MADPHVLPTALAEPLFFRDADAYESWLSILALGPPVLDEQAFARYAVPVRPEVDVFLVPAAQARFQLRERRRRRRRA